MRFGIFGSAQARRGGPDVDSGAGFREFVDYNVEAEQLGYHASFVVEHHFTGFGQISAPLNLLTWIGARTSTLRLGTAVMTLPWHNPVLLAEQAATVLCSPAAGSTSASARATGTTSSPGSAFPWRRPRRASRRRTTSSSRRGRPTRRGRTVARTGSTTTSSSRPPTPKTPPPPLWMGAGRPASIKKVADYGYNLLLDQFAPVEQIGERIALFKAEVEARGRMFDPM